MASTFRTGAVGALLDEYEKAINELQRLIHNISPAELLTVVDAATANPDCRSVQTILAHVVRAGFAYAIDIRQHAGRGADAYPAKVYHLDVRSYEQELCNMFAYTAATLSAVQDAQLEQLNEKLKIQTPWGQSYDIEQLMEHAIVHVLRHRRQLGKFKRSLRQRQ